MLLNLPKPKLPEVADFLVFGIYQGKYVNLVFSKISSQAPKIWRESKNLVLSPYVDEFFSTINSDFENTWINHGFYTFGEF